MPFIVLVNIVLKTGLALLVRPRHLPAFFCFFSCNIFQHVPQEKHHTRTESDRSMAHKVFIAQFINTALVTLLVNTRIQNFAEKFSTDGGSKFPLFTGAYEDFNLAWCVSRIFPRAPKVLIFYVIGRFGIIVQGPDTNSMRNQTPPVTRPRPLAGTLTSAATTWSP